MNSRSLPGLAETAIALRLPWRRRPFVNRDLRRQDWNCSGAFRLATLRGITQFMDFLLVHLGGYLPAHLILAIAVAFVAARKGRSGLGFFFYALLILPVALVHVLVLDWSDKAAADKAKIITNPSDAALADRPKSIALVECLGCDEFVRLSDRFCPHCGWFLTDDLDIFGTCADRETMTELGTVEKNLSPTIPIETVLNVRYYENSMSLKSGSLSIGRHDTNALVISPWETLVSRKHGKISSSDGAYKFTDHSLNGSFVVYAKKAGRPVFVNRGTVDLTDNGYIFLGDMPGANFDVAIHYSIDPVVPSRLE